jgi:acyl-CoA hydrolase
MKKRSGKVVQLAELDLVAVLKPTDRVIWGQGGAEPLRLIEALVAQRSAYSGIRVFLTISFAEVLQPEHSDHIRFEGLGGLGSNARLCRDGLLDVYPTHFGSFCRDIAAGRFDIDVFMVQLAGPDANGRYSFSTDHGYAADAARRARVVIAEVNAQAPFINGQETLGAEDIDLIVHTDRPLPEMARAVPDDVDYAIAAHVLPFIEDGTTLQVGVGGVPSAVLEQLRHHRDLGVHSGMISDTVLELIEAGVVTNARKPFDSGVSVCCALYGSRDFYRRCAAAPIELYPATYTSNVDVMARLGRLVGINSAVQVDLSGQINAEYVAGRYVGAPGGQVDFVRAARQASHGKAIFALRSRSPNGQSRIVEALAGGIVTTPRIDTDLVVTEWGVAALAGKGLKERRAALLAIAHPEDRAALEARAPVQQSRKGA